MKYYIFLFTTCLLLSSLDVTAQKRKPSTEALELLEQAKQQMEKENYDQANLIFRKMLKLKTVLPTEMSYLFAETLFKVGQYENSMNFLKKYQNITDRGSDYYLLSVDLEKLLEEKLVEIKNCTLCNRYGYRLENCEVCDQTGKTIQQCHLCRGHGIITCPACTGKGVIISSNEFDEKEYRTCTRCQSQGFVTCHVCEGKKQIETLCSTCDGTGHRATTQVCDHSAHGGD